MNKFLLASAALLATASAAQATVYTSLAAIQTDTITQAGLYDIIATGGTGGTGVDSATGFPIAGGAGALASGFVYLASGTVLDIVVGGAGDISDGPNPLNNGGFGGGGGGGFSGGGGGGGYSGGGGGDGAIAGGGGGGSFVATSFQNVVITANANSGGAGSVSVTFVPEPASFALLAGALGFMAAFRVQRTRHEVR